MTKTEKIKQAKEVLKTMMEQHLMPTGEAICLMQNLKGEEKEGIAELILNVYKQVRETPKLYGQENIKDPIVHFKYFRGSWTWFVTEFTNIHDAFGFVTSDMCPEGELGYLDLQDITQNGKAELDLHWTPKPLSEVKKEI